MEELEGDSFLLVLLALLPIPSIAIRSDQYPLLTTPPPILVGAPDFPGVSFASRPKGVNPGSIQTRQTRPCVCLSPKRA